MDAFSESALYTFKSTKSNQWYWVWIEEYNYNVYAVKFHLKADRNSKFKYQRLTGLNEARLAINTCIAIMLEINELNPKASFGFIGSNLLTETIQETKRFRVYKKIMLSYFSFDLFVHKEIKDKSAYVMICRTEFENEPDLIRKIEIFFSDNYDYFD